MTADEREMLKRLLATFKVEAEEHVNLLSSGLVDLEKASTAERQREVIETVFREAHSLKGAARAVNLVAVEAVCQSLESIFSELKAQKLAVSPQLLDRLHEMIAGLSSLLSDAGSE